MSELKRCPFCGESGAILDEPFNEDEYGVFCNAKCGAVGPCDEDGEKAIEFWNTRPIEDALEKENAELRNVIIGMFPMWINAMGYCEHGKQAQLLAMRNYYNGRENPLTTDQIHLMFSVIPEKGK